MVYIGRVETRRVPYQFKNEFRTSVSYDREREMKVLEKLQGKAKKSAWAERIAAHVAELNAGKPEAAAPPGPK